MCERVDGVDGVWQWCRWCRWRRSAVWLTIQKRHAMASHTNTFWQRCRRLREDVRFETRALDRRHCSFDTCRRNSSLSLLALRQRKCAGAKMTHICSRAALRQGLAEGIVASETVVLREKSRVSLTKVNSGQRQRQTHYCGSDGRNTVHYSNHDTDRHNKSHIETSGEERIVHCVSVWKENNT